MAENYDISPNSRPKPSQPKSKNASRERSGGPLSDRRIQITMLVAAAVVVLVLAVLLSGAIGGPVKSPDLQAQLRREKALRDREEASQDSSTVPAQPDSGQSYTRGAK